MREILQKDRIWHDEFGVKNQIDKSLKVGLLLDFRKIKKQVSILERFQQN